MNKLLIALFTVLFMLSGCTVKPMVYDLQSINSSLPLKSDINIPKIKVSSFIYEPNVAVSQNEISSLGCLSCPSDGSKSGFLFKDKINTLVKSEVVRALDEIMLPSKNSLCELSARIHLVGFDIIDGDTTIDMTYILKISNNVKFIKRIRGYNNADLFEQHNNRLFSKSTRKTIEILLKNNEFITIINNSCNDK